MILGFLVMRVRIFMIWWFFWQTFIIILNRNIKGKRLWKIKIKKSRKWWKLQKNSSFFPWTLNFPLIVFFDFFFDFNNFSFGFVCYRLKCVIFMSIIYFFLRNSIYFYYWLTIFFRNFQNYYKPKGLKNLNYFSGVKTTPVVLGVNGEFFPLSISLTILPAKILLTAMFLLKTLTGSKNNQFK